MDREDGEAMKELDRLNIDEWGEEFALDEQDGLCPVCGGTGWMQEGWGDYRLDGIPCSACAYDEEEE